MTGRLPAGVRPREVDLRVELDPAKSDRFRGEVEIQLELARPRRSLRLHAVDLAVSRPRIEWPGGSARGRIRWLRSAEMIEVQLPRTVPAGAARLRLAFAGRLRRDLCGLYAARSGRLRFAFTQLEAADARKFFPCFDEPALKARFRLTVTTGAANAVVSNAPVARTRRGPRGRKTVEFRPTPPLSTYLVALAVGPLARSKPVRLGPTEIRIWHAPGKQRLTGFGLEAARESLARLERWFGLPYPYEKLDLVAVPDFEFGAMENAGAVFFRETLLLLDPATATLAEQKRAAEVIAHELAHMWFGDLVTMAWWDDLWLNEAFATWLAFAVVDDWKPEWRIWHDFQHGRAAALELDALRNTHPIYSPVRTAAEASQNFDLITYEKGASVVRMLERYLGAAVFRRGVRRYIRRHREGNTVAADLWRALSEASGQAIEPLARAWIERAGHPVVSVRRVEGPARTRVELAQTRFAETRRGAPRRAPPWPIPWVARVVGPGGGRGRLTRHLLTRARETVALPRGRVRLVYGNADESGFFRPHHAGADLAALLAAPSRLTAVERMGLADHQWALARAGRAPLASLLELVAAWSGEPDPDMLAALQRPLGFLADVLVPDAAPACAAALRGFAAACFGPAFEAAGWDPARGESAEARLRRAALLGLVGGVAGEPNVLAEAARRCERYLDDRRSIDANLADGVVSLAARVGDASLHRRLAAAAAAASTPQEQRRFLLALGAFRAPDLVAKSLALSLTEAVATQDVAFLLLRLLANPAAREASWDFLRSRWPRLRRRLPPLLTGRLIEATWQLATPAHRREVASFFARHPVPAGERALRQALERFDWYRSFRTGAARELTAWLAPRTDRPR